VVGGWEIGVAMDEIPFAVEAAIDCVTRMVIEAFASLIPRSAPSRP
jgi:hypothetical protein